MPQYPSNGQTSNQEMYAHVFAALTRFTYPNVDGSWKPHLKINHKTKLSLLKFDMEGSAVYTVKAKKEKAATAATAKKKGDKAAEVKLEVKQEQRGRGEMAESETDEPARKAPKTTGEAEQAEQPKKPDQSERLEAGQQNLRSMFSKTEQQKDKPGEAATEATEGNKGHDEGEGEGDQAKEATAPATKRNKRSNKAPTQDAKQTESASAASASHLGAIEAMELYITDPKTKNTRPKMWLEDVATMVNSVTAKLPKHKAIDWGAVEHVLKNAFEFAFEKFVKFRGNEVSKWSLLRKALKDYLSAKHDIHALEEAADYAMTIEDAIQEEAKEKRKQLQTQGTATEVHYTAHPH